MPRGRSYRPTGTSTTCEPSWLSFSAHRQPADAEKIISGLRDLQRRATVADNGFDGLGVVVIDCANDGSPITHVTRHPPAPEAADDFDYSRFVHRLAQLYAMRFAQL